MTRSAMLRFSEEDFAERQKRRERFKAGEIHVPERDILSACLEFCKRHPAVAWAVRQNTGAGYVLRPGVYKRLIAAGHIKQNEAQFMRFGFVGGGDITGQLREGGRRFEVETKSDTGRVSEEQQAVHEAVNTAGGLHIIARSVTELAEALKGG